MSDEYSFRVADKPDATTVRLKYVEPADSDKIVNVYVNDKLIDFGDMQYHSVGVDGLMLRYFGFIRDHDGYKVILATNLPLVEVSQDK